MGTITGTICILNNMSYSITLDFRLGTKKPVKELRIRIRSAAAKVDVRKVTVIRFVKSTLISASKLYQ